MSSKKKHRPVSLDFGDDVNITSGNNFLAIAVGDLVSVRQRSQPALRRPARITKIKKSKTYKGMVIIDFELIGSADGSAHG